MNVIGENDDTTDKIHNYGLKALESSRLIVIDTIRIDEHSRLTYTKKVKSVFPVAPQDTIVVYQDKYNQDELLFKIQREGSVVDSWLVKRKRIAIESHNRHLSKNTNQEVRATKNDTEPTANYNTPKSTKANIMLVDDELDVLYAFETILSNQKYRVKAFTGPKEALKHLLEQNNYTHYDLAIIDIRLPDINGIQLYQILKIINKRIKVLFVSALDAAEELTSLFPEIKRGDILRKPISQQLFIEKIERTLASKSS